MKKCLSILVAFIFLQTQMWALSGGPVYTLSKGSDLTGTFAGVMVAKTSVGTPPSLFSLQASLGAFSITVPVSGQATGNTVFFQNNVAYTGTIFGAADPHKNTLTGIIQATSTAHFVINPAVQVVNTTGAPPNQITVITNVPAVTSPLIATGSIQAKVTRHGVTNNGNAAVDGVARGADPDIGGLDANGNPVSLGKSGDTLSGSAIISSLIQNDAVTGGPQVTDSTKYSISGIRQTDAIGTAAAP